MKTINKLLTNRKSNKILTAAKILIPVAGAIAAKKLWDKKGTFVLDNARSKVLDKTEEFQEKVQKFHDFVQSSLDESVENVFVDETVEENVHTEAESGGESDENSEETMEEPQESREEIIAESEEIEKKSEAS